MLFSAKTLNSFVYAASTVSGVMAAVGHALQARVRTSGEHSTSNIGRKMQSRRFRTCFVKIRLWKCAIAIFDGKHGSMAPRLEPDRYISLVVKSEYTMFSGNTPRLSR